MNCTSRIRMDRRIDETGHVIFLSEFVSKKRYKEEIIHEIIAAICAMLNSNGGKVVIDIKTDSNETPVDGLPFYQTPLVIRILEQSMISIIGKIQTVSNINFQEDKKGLLIFVKETDFLVTTSYNLYLPSASQVALVSPLEPLEKVKDDIINRKIVPEQVQIGSHCHIFSKGTICGFHESKTLQLKHLEAYPTKRTTLADRMIGKGNKLKCYVSSHANHKGGHLYYGITDNRMVVGEIILNEEDKREIIKKVEKVIKKMIWPEHIGQPKRGGHWDIFFEPVLDEDNKPMLSTFVIVIYVAACAGGVFTEEPECYEMVEGKVTRMSLIKWKKTISSRPTELYHVGDISSRFKRVTWSSTRIRNTCVFADRLLTQCVNNGQSIETISENLEQTFPDHKDELKLLILSKKVMISYRSNCFITAKDLLEEYTDLLTATTEFEFFDAIRVYLETAFHRAKGDFESLSAILPGAYAKAEMIEPGIISAAIYLLVAMVETLFQSKDAGKLRVETPAIFSIRAFQHLQCVTDSPVVKTDMKRKSHIASALFFLGGDISGKLTKVIDSTSLERAYSSITAVETSIDERKPINRYRAIQFNIVNSLLQYRYSQVQLDNKVLLLKKAFDFSKKAESIGTEFRFMEMLEWARACMALCTEGLVRIHFKPSTCQSRTFSEEHASKSL